MKIRYENTIEDVIVFNLYHWDHSPSYQRSKAWAVWLLPTLLLLIFGVNQWLGEDPPPIIYSAVGYGILAALWVLITPPVLRWHLLRHVRKVYTEGANKRFFCPHELELMNDGLIERTPLEESKTLWPAIEKVVSTNEYTFIYNSAMSALVVPRGAVLEGSYEAFVGALNDRLDQEQLKAQGCQDW